MKNNPILKRVKNNNYTLKHISQAEIDKISQTNFVFYYNECHTILLIFLQKCGNIIMLLQNIRIIICLELLIGYFFVHS